MLPKDVAQNTGTASQHINDTHPLKAIASSSNERHVSLSRPPQYCFPFQLDSRKRIPHRSRQTRLELLL
jgi:hypothetical protein